MGGRVITISLMLGALFPGTPDSIRTFVTTGRVHTVSHLPMEFVQLGTVQ
jgi:hypothetical protein